MNVKKYVMGFIAYISLVGCNHPLYGDQISLSFDSLYPETGVSRALKSMKQLWSLCDAVDIVNEKNICELSLLLRKTGLQAYVNVVALTEHKIEDDVFAYINEILQATKDAFNNKAAYIRACHSTLYGFMEILLQECEEQLVLRDRLSLNTE